MFCPCAFWWSGDTFAGAMNFLVDEMEVVFGVDEAGVVWCEPGCFRFFVAVELLLLLLGLAEKDDVPGIGSFVCGAVVFGPFVVACLRVFTPVALSLSVLGDAAPWFTLEEALLEPPDRDNEPTSSYSASMSRSSA